VAALLRSGVRPGYIHWRGSVRMTVSCAVRSLVRSALVRAQTRARCQW